MTEHDPAGTPNAAFPNLTPTNHRVIGPATHEYNCIAWACGDTHRWWQPGPHFHWPVPCDPDDSSLANLLAALGAVGFAPHPHGPPEPGFERIAVYALGPGEYTHAAKQTASGTWTSKLGTDALVEHDTPDAVAGGLYGSVVQFLRRSTPPDDSVTPPSSGT